MQAKTSSEKRVGQAVFAVSALVATGTGILALGARRSGRSMKGQFVAGILLKLTNRAGASATPEGVSRMIVRNRKAGPARPPARVRRQLDVQLRDIAGGEAYVVAKRDASSPIRILYIHGGAFQLDLLPAHWPIIASLVEDTEAVLTAPLYPLAPENDWQAAFAMIDALYADMIAEVGAQSVVLAGDSAGGGLALSLCQMWRDRGIALPAGLVMFSPWADVTVSDPAQTEIARRDMMLSIDRLRDAGFAWAGARKTNDPVVSPLFGSLAGLPPMLVLSGTDDILNSDAHRLKTSANASGVDLQLSEYPGMFHVWVGAPIPEAARALDEAAAFIERLMG